MKSKKKLLEERYGKTILEIMVDAFCTTNTQRGVAEKLGVTQGTISLWLKQERVKMQMVLIPDEGAINNG